MTESLTDHEWGIILSCDQNGFFPVIRSERVHVEGLVKKGLLDYPDHRVSATLTPSARALIDALEKGSRH